MWPAAAAKKKKKQLTQSLQPVNKKKEKKATNFPFHIRLMVSQQIFPVISTGVNHFYPRSLFPFIYTLTSVTHSLSVRHTRPVNACTVRLTCALGHINSTLLFTGNLQCLPSCLRVNTFSSISICVCCTHINFLLTCKSDSLSLTCISNDEQSNIFTSTVSPGKQRVNPLSNVSLVNDIQLSHWYA